MLVESKSILAKLLAKENIKVEHKKVQTAYFDLASRTLVCPIWTDMSPELYDLLMGHEVGHAKNTPSEGWHNAVVGNERRGFKTYLNVVEDARIERKIKAEYPGLKSSFSKAYAELAAKEFFGPRDIIEAEELLLIDRINLHFKIGPFANIKFAPHEKKFVDAVATTETWEDVECVATMLYKHGLQERKELRDLLQELMKDFELSKMKMDDIKDDYDDLDMNFEDEEFEDLELQDQIDRLRNLLGKPKGDQDIDDDDDPASITDMNFRQKESDLLDTQAKPYLYADMPTPNMKNVVNSYKKLKDTFDFKTSFRYTLDRIDGFDHVGKAMQIRDELYLKFLNGNRKYISYLVKEFEMKRNAKQFARAKVSKSGEVDIKKVFSYQYNEDIFKRVTEIPGGKNHGMVMMIDFSGSMANSIKGTIEQTLLLAMFCRKVSIPFRVYSFTDRGHRLRHLDPKYKFDPKDLFSVEKGELKAESYGFVLNEYLSDCMSQKEFTEAIKNLLMLSESLGDGKFSNYSNCKNEQSEDALKFQVHYGSVHELGGTPLNEGLITLAEIVPEFKQMYKLDIVNTIILTDGQGHELIYKYTGEQKEIKWQGDEEGHIDYKVESLGDYNAINCNVVIKHKKTGMTAKAGPQQSISSALLEMISKLSGGNVIGFYLMPKPTARNIYGYCADQGKYYSYEETDAAAKSIRRNKFAIVEMPGYKKFFIMPNGSDIEIEDDGLDVKDNASKNELRRAFMRMQKNKLVNRVFLSKFIDQIA